jgi:hypothetical protein
MHRPVATAASPPGTPTAARPPFVATVHAHEMN